MNALKLLSALALGCIVGSCATVRAADTTEFEVRFAAMEQKLGVPPTVQPAAHTEEMPSLHLPEAAGASSSDEVVVVANDPTCSDPTCDDSTCCHDVCCDPACLPSYWRFEVGAGPSRLNIANSAFGRLPDEAGTAVQFDLAYETDRGQGMRGQLWSFGQDVSTHRMDVEVRATSFDLDFYKRFWGEDGDLAVGVAASGAVLNFQLPNGRESQYGGAGPGLFAEGFYNVIHFKKSDLGMIGRGRVTILEGGWDDNTGIVVPNTKNDMMVILEAGFGVEFRRYFGRCEDKYWHIAMVTDFQRWDSEWMSSNLGSSTGFAGGRFELGVAW